MVGLMTLSLFSFGANWSAMNERMKSMSSMKSTKSIDSMISMKSTTSIDSMISMNEMSIMESMISTKSNNGMSSKQKNEQMNIFSSIIALELLRSRCFISIDGSILSWWNMHCPRRTLSLVFFNWIVKDCWEKRKLLNVEACFDVLIWWLNTFQRNNWNK